MRLISILVVTYPTRCKSALEPYLPGIIRPYTEIGREVSNRICRFLDWVAANG